MFLTYTNIFSGSDRDRVYQYRTVAYFYLVPVLQYHVEDRIRIPMFSRKEPIDVTTAKCKILKNRGKHLLLVKSMSPTGNRLMQ